MDKEYFKAMTLSEQLAHVNTRLEGGESMRAISSSLGIHKNTIPSLLTKNGYILDKVAKQYILANSQHAQPITEQDNKPIPTTSQDHRPTFNIPTKTKTVTKNKAFNTIMKESLVDKLDQLAKEKGYSRNRLISYICNFFIENMEK